MTTRIYWLIASMVGIALLAFAIRTEGADDFYKGKTIRFVVGFAAGGGYDLAARVVGRHMGKHIPGNPTIVVENMTGNRELKMGATAPGSTYDDLPEILDRTIGTKFNVISGYEGTGPILVAMRRKEVDGGCWTWESARTTARPMLDAKGEDRLIPFLIHSREPDPEVKELPLIPEVIKGEDNLSAYRTWAGTYEFQRPFSVPPGTPKERLQLLRKAFADTMKDSEFIAEAKKSKLEVTYVSAEEIDKHVNTVLSITPKARELLDFLMAKPKR
jgi:hypothetical protein